MEANKIILAGVIVVLAIVGLNFLVQNGNIPKGVAGYLCTELSNEVLVSKMGDGYAVSSLSGEPCSFDSSNVSTSAPFWIENEQLYPKVQVKNFTGACQNLSTNYSANYSMLVISDDLMMYYCQAVAGA